MPDLSDLVVWKLVVRTQFSSETESSARTRLRPKSTAMLLENNILSFLDQILESKERFFVIAMMGKSNLRICHSHMHLQVGLHIRYIH